MVSRWKVEQWEEEEGPWWPDMPERNGSSVLVRAVRRLHRRHTDARHRLAEERHRRAGEEGGAAAGDAAAVGQPPATGKSRRRRR